MKYNQANKTLYAIVIIDEFRRSDEKQEKGAILHLFEEDKNYKAAVYTRRLTSKLISWCSPNFVIL